MTKQDPKFKPGDMVRLTYNNPIRENIYGKLYGVFIEYQPDFKQQMVLPIAKVYWTDIREYTLHHDYNLELVQRGEENERKT